MEPIKVFITEDESIVREGLRDIVPWEKYGFEFVGDAPDGEIALPMIRKLRPDVLITDIKMPFMDGLALSSIVSRELPNTKIIILSGYSDFEYARQAINLRVDQYLLKPITKSAILKALEFTGQKIQEEREQKDFLRRYEQDTQKYERFSRRAFFERLVEGSMSVQEIYEEAQRLHLDLNADGYNFILFSVQSARSNAYSEEATAALDALLDYFLRYPGYVLFRSGLLSYAVLMMGDKDALKGLAERALDTIQRRCGAAGESLSWCAAVGTPTYRVSGLAQCYSEANHVLAYRHLMPGVHVFRADMLHSEGENAGVGSLKTLDPGKLDATVIRSFIQSGTPEEIEGFAAEYLSGLAGAERSLMFRHYILMSVRINAEVVLQQLGCRMEDFSQLPTPEMNLPVDQIQRYIESVLTAALRLRDEKSQQESSDIINSAVRYIEKNYTDENISLNSVAQAINISANYLSACFSQKMEISFVEYLTKKRMSRAKQLLVRTNLRTSEIAAEVGYRDPRYFSFVFRKTQGCTPRAFRSGEGETE